MEKIDPLYVIFEKHLFEFQDSNIDRKTLIANIVNSYMDFLRKGNVTIPAVYEAHVIEELFGQVNTMLTKKIYGFLSVEEFAKGLTRDQKEKADRNYRRLKGSDAA